MSGPLGSVGSFSAPLGSMGSISAPLGSVGSMSTPRGSEDWRQVEDAATEAARVRNLRVPDLQLKSLAPETVP